MFYACIVNLYTNNFKDYIPWFLQYHLQPFACPGILSPSDHETKHLSAAMYVFPFLACEAC